MIRLIFVICVILLPILYFSGCFNDECSVEMLDYNNNGKVGDAGDYDLKKQIERECRNDGGW